MITAELRLEQSKYFDKTAVQTFEIDISRVFYAKLDHYLKKSDKNFWSHKIFIEAMAVYFDHKIQAPSVGTQTGIAWHKNHPLLAVASKHDPDIAGSVNLYLDEVRFYHVRIK